MTEQREHLLPFLWFVCCVVFFFKSCHLDHYNTVSKFEGKNNGCKAGHKMTQRYNSEGSPTVPSLWYTPWATKPSFPSVLSSPNHYHHHLLTKNDHMHHNAMLTKKNREVRTGVNHVTFLAEEREEKDSVLKHHGH